MTITAKFPGICPCCSKSITPGDKVEWSKGAKARHSACSGAPSVSAPQSSTAGRYPRRQLLNGDVYTGRNGQRKVFGCSDCTRLGRMCWQCAHDDE